MAAHLRAVMPIIVTVRGFDTTDLVLDLAEYIKDSLGWAKLGENVIAYDSVPIEARRRFRSRGEDRRARNLNCSVATRAGLHSRVGRSRSSR